MPNLKTKADLIASIEADLANNNAGAISAEDIRHNLADTAHSINLVVASGDHDVEFPFVGDVRASKAEGGGFFIAESGISFPNASGNTTQYEAWPGAASINHDDLAGRHADADAHTQYLPVDGSRGMEENLPMGNHWIGASGDTFDERGLKFIPQAEWDDVKVGGSGSIVFGDNSGFNSARGVAKAWVTFDGSGTGSYGTPVIRAHHNILSLQYLDPGKYKITVPSGVLQDEDFLPIGNSNSRTTAASQEDFARNTVGCVQRSMAVDGTASVTFLVLNEAGEYVDAELNDLVIYGYDEGETAQPAPTIIPK